MILAISLIYFNLYSFYSSKVPPKASGKRLGRPPKKGTHLNVNSLGHLASAPSSKSVGIDPSSRKRSPQSSPERDNEDVKKRRKRSPSKRYWHAFN